MISLGWLWALLFACRPSCSVAQVANGGRCEAIALSGVSERAVSFDNGTFTLEGTLSVPETSGEQPLPAVILVHGSGPADRDETADGQLMMYFGFEVKLFAALADALVHEGFVVLRYDKRSCNSENGCVNDYPALSDARFDDFLADAQAGVRFLSEQPEVNTQKIVALGHSQGGQIVQYLNPNTVRAIGLLAAPAEPIDLAFGYQREKVIAVYAQYNATQAQLDQQTADLDERLAGLSVLRSGADPGPFGGASSDFWRGWLEASDGALQATQNWPGEVLVVQGDYDWNVPVSQAERYEAALANQGFATVRVLPGLTHVFTRITQPEWDQIRPGDISTSVDPELFSVLIEWLNK